jgi:inosine-uridine nucleoside N-ribohydrolase
VPLTAGSYNRLTAGPQTPEAQFVADVLTQQRGLVEAGGFFFWDPLAATLLAGEPLAAFESRPLSVITADGPESGRLVAAPSGPAVRVAVSADQARFEAHFVDVLNAQWP